MATNEFNKLTVLDFSAPFSMCISCVIAAGTCAVFLYRSSSMPSGLGKKSRPLLTVPHGAKEKAQLGLSLLKEAVLEFAKVNPKGITNLDTASLHYVSLAAHRTLVGANGVNLVVDSRRNVMASMSAIFRCSFGMAIAIVGIATAAVTCNVGAAMGQTYPTRPIRLVLPFLPGTPNDVVARILGPRLSAAFKQPVIIDNRPGGGTIIGTRAVATAEPDGYTLLLTANNHVIVAAQSSDLGYDAVKDFTPVAGLAKTSWLLTVSPSVPVKTVPELIAYAKKNPGKLNIGFGKGTSPELVSEMFKLEAKADIPSVPYKGGAQVLTDILGGTVELNFGQISTSLPLIRAGKLRALAVTSATRLSDLPDVPTMIESGISSLSGLSFWDGVLAPAGTPAAIVNRLNREINESLKSPEAQAGLAKLGFESIAGTPQDFAAFLQAEFPKWAAMVKATGIRLY